MGYKSLAQIPAHRNGPVTFDVRHHTNTLAALEPPKIQKLMRHDEFAIGIEFCCGGKRWRCTDVGTRVIVAICLEPREMVRMTRDPKDKTKYTQERFISDDPRDLNGPPYGIAESVFDEYDIEGCTIAPEKQDESLAIQNREGNP